jgi:putative ABC transport system permease protein
MNFVTVILKNVVRRKTRSILTIVGLAVAVAATVALVGIASRFEQAYYELYEEQAVDLVVQAGGGSQMLNRGIDEAFVTRLEQLPGVKKAVGGLVDVVAFEEFDLFLVVVNGWEPGSPLFDHLTIKQGRTLQSSDNKHVVLGKMLATNTGKKVGDTIEMYGETMQIVGVFESNNVYENSAVVISLKELQRLMDRPQKITAFLVTAKDRTPAGVKQLKEQIEALMPNIQAEPMQSFVGSVSHIKVSRAMAWMTSAIALFIGAIGMLNTMVMSVHERIKEIGTLRAIGWRKGRVVRMILSESLLLSLLGAAVGTLLAVVLSRYFSHFPATSGFIDGYIAPRFMLLGFLMAVSVGVAGAAYPAWWGASLSPVEALRKK